MGKFDSNLAITDLVHLQTIDGKDIALSGSPGGNNVIRFNLGSDHWDYAKIPLWSVGGVAQMDSGVDLDMNGGNISLPSGGKVDGIDIDAEAITTGGNPFSFPLNDSLLFFNITTGKIELGKTTLINGGDSAQHYHDSDRARANHTGTQTASTIFDFDTEVGNHADVAANTFARHDRAHAITGTSDHTAGNHKVIYTDGSGDVQELALGAAGSVLTSLGTAVAPGFVVANLRLGLFADATGNQSIGSTAVTVNIDYTSVSDTNYSLSSDEIEVNSDGLYIIFYKITFDITNTAGASVGTVQGWLDDDSSGSFATIAGSKSRCFIYELSQGGSVIGFFAKTLSDGDKIRLRAQQVYSSYPNIDTTRYESLVCIMKVGP
jgi:hypothetical protein